jgi:hypothetical protein
MSLITLSQTGSPWHGQSHCVGLHSGTEMQVMYPPQVGMLPAHVICGAHVTVPWHVVHPGQVEIFQHVAEKLQVAIGPQVD